MRYQVFTRASAGAADVLYGQHETQEGSLKLILAAYDDKHPYAFQRDTDPGRDKIKPVTEAERAALAEIMPSTGGR